ncbi:MAG TPA: pseudouridine synthase [Armatimonadota bacterium]|nr:pseudouridine synthase [Armatimonadota bacterium]
MARAGVGARRACGEMIKDGRVSVDGSVVRHPGHKVDPGEVRVTVDGRPIGRARSAVYLLVNKPAGFITTRNDPRRRKTVMDLVDPGLARYIYPVGRLDRDATGLLLLTNDGDLAHRLAHPSHHVPKAYEVIVAGQPDDEALNRLRNRVELDDGPTAPAKVKVHRRAGGHTTLKITLREGRHNQVKRMCAAVGHPVAALRRVSFGSLHIGNMAEGAVRPLRPTEVHALKEAVGMSDKPPDESHPSE